METVRRKKNQQNTIQFIQSWCTTNGIDAHDDFYTGYPFVGWYNTKQDEGHS